MILRVKDADGDIWEIVVIRGATPVKGTDYWTETDKAEIVAEVLAALPAAEEASV